MNGRSEYQKSYREAHRDHIKEYCKKYAMANKDKLKAYWTEYNATHRDAINRKMREHYKRKKAESIPVICLRCGYEWDYRDRGKTNTRCPECHSKHVEYKDKYDELFSKKA